MSWLTILADHLDRWEGLRLEAYQDRKNGVWTIGWGHTGPEVKPGLVITKEKAEEYLADDIAWAEECFNNTVKVQTNDKIKASIVSLIFNIGATAWSKKATALRRLNTGDYEGCAEAMTWWNKDQDPNTGQLVTVPGLVNRREAERALFMEGYAELTSPPRTGPVEAAYGGEAKPLTQSKTLGTSIAGLGTAAASLVGGFSTMDWKVAVPLIVCGCFFAYLAFNRWLEARRGEH